MLHKSPLLLVIALFLLLATPSLDKPGLHYDEALEAGLPAVQMLHGQPVTAAHGVVLHIAGREWPLMAQNHIGALQTYAALPFIALGGPTATALRSMTVAVGLLTLLAVWSFLAQTYGTAAACYGTLWLATWPSFVFWSRQGVFVTSLAPCLLACGLAAGARWWHTRRGGMLGLAGLCLGLAVYAKISALWVVNGMVAWGLLLACSAGRRDRVWTMLRAGRQPGALALAGFLAGITPLLLYNLLSGGATLQVVQANTGRTYLGADNTQLLANLQTRLAQAFDVLRSGEHLWYLGGTFPNNVSVIALAVASAAILAGCVLHKRAWRSLLFAPFLAGAVLLQSCYTISALWPTHFAVAAALPALVFGAGAMQLQRWTQRTPLRHAVAVGAALVCLAQVQTDLRYLDAIKTTGGLSFHSSAICDVTRFLEGRNEHAVALDWGIAAPITYLSGGRVPVAELYTYDQGVPAAFARQLRARLGDDTLYITHAAHQEAFARRDVFLQTVAAAGLRAEAVNVSTRADGWPMLEVWRVLPEHARR